MILPRLFGSCLPILDFRINQDLFRRKLTSCIQLRSNVILWASTSLSAAIGRGESMALAPLRGRVQLEGNTLDRHGYLVDIIGHRTPS